MNRVIAVTLLVVSAWCLSGVSQAAEPPSRFEQVELLLRQLRSEDIWMASDAFSRLARQRDVAVDALLKLASSDPANDREDQVKGEAIELLGKFRERRAVDVLVDQITYISYHSPPGHMRPLEMYCAAAALVKIGNVALPSILHRGMGGPLQSKNLEIRAHVIYWSGGGQELGVFHIQRTLDSLKAELDAAADRRGTVRKPSPKEKNLARLLEIFKGITGSIKDNLLPSEEELKELYGRHPAPETKTNYRPVDADTKKTTPRQPPRRSPADDDPFRRR